MRVVTGPLRVRDGGSIVDPLRRRRPRPAGMDDPSVVGCGIAATNPDRSIVVGVVGVRFDDKWLLRSASHQIIKKPRFPEIRPEIHLRIIGGLRARFVAGPREAWPFHGGAIHETGVAPDDRIVNGVGARDVPGPAVAAISAGLALVNQSARAPRNPRHRRHLLEVHPVSLIVRPDNFPTLVVHPVDQSAVSTALSPVTVAAGSAGLVGDFPEEEVFTL